MKIVIFVTLCLYSLCQAFPAGEDYSQDQAPTTQGGSLKEHLQANQGQYALKLFQLIKKYGPKEQLERWYSLPRSDRQCIINKKKTLALSWISGYNTANEDECIAQLKQACPNASAAIDAWYNESLAHRQEAYANWTEKYNDFPQSVKDFLTNLNKTFQDLRLSHSLVPPNKTAIQAALLPVVQQFLAISQADRDQFVQEVPKAELILGTNGNLTTQFYVLVRAFEEGLRTGNVTEETASAAEEAKKAFKQYGEEKYEQYYPSLKQQVESAPEQEFSPQVHSELANSVRETVATAVESAPSS